MPLTVAQTTAFFEGDQQMGIPHATVVQLVAEGITTVDDLADFDKETIEQIAANLRRPAGRVPDPNPGAAPGAAVATGSAGAGAAWLSPSPPPIRESAAPGAAIRSSFLDNSNNPPSLVDI